MIFTSDNGFMEGQHRIQTGKLVAYEPATALPLLMRGPGIPAGRVSREPVIDTDLAPTILDMTDSPHSGWTIDGRSMLPFAQAPGRPRTSRPRLMEIGPQASQRGDLDQDGGRVRPGVALKAPRYGGVATTRYRYMRYANGQEELVRPGPGPRPARQPHLRPPVPRHPPLPAPPAHAPEDMPRRGVPQARRAHPRPDGLEAVLDDVARRLDQREVGERRKP